VADTLDEEEDGSTGLGIDTAGVVHERKETEIYQNWTRSHKNILG
jgi:hypothetical protein